MPTFKTSKELEDYILSKSRDAVTVAQEKAYNIIDEVLKKYYSWTPEFYNRMEKLLHSLVKSSVEIIGNTVVAEVYFDESQLVYEKGWVLLKKPFRDGTTHGYATWSTEQILDAAMHGSDAITWRNPTAIWDESVPMLRSDVMNTLVKELKKAGIPIK